MDDTKKLRLYIRKLIESSLTSDENALMFESKEMPKTSEQTDSKGLKDNIDGTITLRS